jgi:hypothetical protein
MNAQEQDRAASGRSAQEVELPAPTAWPLVCGAGLALAFAGPVTHVAVSAVGAVVFVVGACGWMREVLPAERTEHVPVEEAEDTTPAVQAALPAVGEGGHRMAIPQAVHPYSAGLRGGAVGAVAMAAVAVAYGWLAQDSVWYPINLLAAVASPDLASASLDRLRAFSAAGLALGTLVHGAISLLVGLLYAVILPMLPGSPLLWGGVVAPLLWSGGIWATLGLVNPALNQRIEWGAFVISQLAFGLVVGWVVARSERVQALQGMRPAVRAGLQGSEPPEEPRS